MIALRVALPVLVFLSLIHSAVAQERRSTAGVFSAPSFALADLSREDGIYVAIGDDVTDGCWYNTQRAKSFVERLLAAAGFRKFVGADQAEIRVNLNATGYSQPGYDGLCVVNASFTVAVFEGSVIEMETGMWFNINVWETVYHSQNLMTGDRSRMSQRVFDTFADQTRWFLGDVLEAERDIRILVRDSSASTIQKAELIDRIEK